MLKFFLLARRRGTELGHSIAVKKTGGAAAFAAIEEDDGRVTIEIAPTAGGSSGTIRVRDGKQRGRPGHGVVAGLASRPLCR